MLSECIQNNKSPRQAPIFIQISRHYKPINGSGSAMKKQILTIAALSLATLSASAYTLITHANNTLDALAARGQIQGVRDNGTPCFFSVTKYAYTSNGETDNQYLVQVSTVTTGYNTNNTIAAPTAFNENITTPDSVHMQVSVPENNHSVFLFTMNAQGQVESFVATSVSDETHAKTTIECTLPK